MKTIAIIGSCDTKYREISDPSKGYDVSREEVAESAGVSWQDMEPKSKGEKISFMTEAVAGYVEKIYQERKVDGIVSAGGLQNTVMATAAMQRLPIGVPKVMATTVASGRKTFESIVADKDIVTIPSICDFTGLNLVTRQIIANACAACVGMVKNGHYKGGGLCSS